MLQSCYLVSPLGMEVFCGAAVGCRRSFLEVGYECGHGLQHPRQVKPTKKLCIVPG